jgi:hypothetical protein
MISIETISPKNGIKASQGFGSSLDEYTPRPEKWKFDFKTKAEKLRITINGMDKIPLGLPGEENMPWIFMDEITIK